MNLRLLTLFAALTLHVLSAFGDWKEIEEITLTLPTGTSPAAQGHYVKVTFLKDGTAVKRDFTESAVYNGSIAKAIYEGLAKSVLEEGAFGTVQAEGDKPAKEAVIVYAGEKKKIRLPYKEKPAALVKIEAAIDLIRWKKI